MAMSPAHSGHRRRTRAEAGRRRWRLPCRALALALALWALLTPTRAESVITGAGATAPSPFDVPAGDLIVDTDTALFVHGLDIDDDLALLFLTAAGARVRGITNTFGNDVSERTHNDTLQLQRRVPRLAAAAPAFRGADALAPHAPTAASRFIADTLRASGPRNTTVLCVGAMSNLATALRGEPELADRIGRLVLLGGDLDPNASSSSLVFAVESGANYYFDLESTAELLNLTRGVPTAVLAVQMLVRAAVTEEVVARLGRCPGPAVVAAADVHPRIAAWQTSHAARMNRTFGHLPGFAPGGFFPWDVHAAALVTLPQLYGDFGTYVADVTPDLRLRFREVPAGEANIVSPRTVNATAFLDAVVAHLCAV